MASVFEIRTSSRLSLRVLRNVFTVLEAEMVAGAGVLRDVRDSACYVWVFKRVPLKPQ